MKRLNSIILATCVILSSGLLFKSMPAASSEIQANVRTKGAVKAEGDPSPETLSQKLNLTADQKKKAAKIFVETNQKIAKYLNPAQLKKLEAGVKAKQGMSYILQSLNLSSDQKKNIGTVMMASRKQFFDILTAEQKQKLIKMTSTTMSPMK